MTRHRIRGAILRMEGRALRIRCALLRLEGRAFRILWGGQCP